MTEHLGTDAILVLNETFGEGAVATCQHVVDCAHCKEEISVLNVLAESLRTGDLPSAAMTAKAVAAVRAQIDQDGRRSHSILLHALVFVAAGATALVAISMTGGISLLRPNVAALLVAVITGSVASIRCNGADSRRRLASRAQSRL